MSDSFKGLMVILEEDHENDDRQKFVDAIMLMTGVADVQIIETDGFQDILIKSRTIATIRKEINEVISKISKGETKLLK